MKILSKSTISIGLFMLTNNLFSQDYYKLSQDFFGDTKSLHVDFVKKAIQEHDAEQLILDYYDLLSKHDKDVEDTNIKIKEIEDNFEANNESPEDSYTCKKTIEYKNKAESAESRVKTLKSLLNTAETALNLCKNNVSRTGNCNELVNNYNKQLDYFNNAIDQYNSAKDNYNYYKPDCDEIVNDYNNAYNYAKRQIDNLIADHEERINGRDRKFKDYDNKIREIFLDTPMYTIEYHDNGNKSEEGYLDLKTNQYVGVFKRYYANGNLELECVLKNGQPNGHYIEYYETGIKKTEVDYKDGAVVGSRKNYNEEGVDEQAEREKMILDYVKEEDAVNEMYYETIDNSSVAESIAANPIRTIKENNIELVIDFSKASKETINFFLVRYDNYKSTELREQYLEDFWDTQGEKVSCRIFNNEGKLITKVVYEGLIAITELYSNDGRIIKGNYKGVNRVGIWKVYDKNGKIVQEVDFDEQNKINAFEYFSKN